MGMAISGIRRHFVSTLFLLAPVCLMAGAPPELNPAAVRLVDSGFDHFYNLEYDQSIADFREAARVDPDSPEAWNHLSQGLFYAALFDGGLMGSDLIKSNDTMMKTPKLV